MSRSAQVNNDVDDEELIKRDTLYVAPRNGPTRLVETAPETDLHKSKRYDGLATRSRELDHKKKFLVDQALEKERIFKENVANLRTRIAEFKLKVGEEVEDRAAQLATAKARFEVHLAQAVGHVDEELEASVAVVSDDWIPPPTDRLNAWKDDFDHFVNVTVPETIENQSGRVTRHLIKAQETFEIDNTKLLRREKKIEERFENHVHAVRENMTEVTRKRKDCFILFEEDLYNEERDSDRAEERHVGHTHARIEQVQAMQGGLAGHRAQTDSDILVAIEETMSRLQKSVLENFGVEAAYK